MATQRQADAGFVVGLLVGLLVVGAVLIYLGNRFEEPYLLTLGGAVIGTSAGGVIGSMDVRRVRRDILENFQDALGLQVRSDETELRPYRRVWHAYHLTEVDGSIWWRHATIDYSRADTPGVLRTWLTSTDRDSSPTYKYDGFCRGSRFLQFGKAEDSGEPWIVMIYPSMGESFRYLHPGVAFYRTWEGNDVASKCLMTKEAIDGYKKYGNVPPDLNERLHAAWDDEWSRVLTDLTVLDEQDPNLRASRDDAD